MRGNAATHELVAPGELGAVLELLAAEQEVARKQARDFLEKGIKSGVVRVEISAQNRHLHFWVESPPD